LPDGNKRCAFLALERFLDANGKPILDANRDTDVPMMERIAAGGASQGEIAAWIEQRSSAVS
jgi:prophage maintenance system killer protein